MPSEYRSLIMRSNRLLGAALVEANLIKIEDLEKANERLLEIIALDQPRQCTVLGILAYEMKALREEDALQHVVDNEGVGLVDLRDYDVSDEVKRSIDPSACWATWAVPFDHEEDFHFVATAYYLSPPVRAFWEKQLNGPILWFGTTLEGIADFLEKTEAENSGNPAGGGTRSPFNPAAIAAAGATVSPFPTATPAAGTSNTPFPKPKSASPFNVPADN
ncbi:MAG TPA: hypothetical protein PLF88_07965 [Opitutaceae bacterium]|nr:hypothetical protein [Opitutaceae bacterium]HRJ48426.1 hypothetical protein [Opitutaceae bacterium]